MDGLADANSLVHTKSAATLRSLSVCPCAVAGATQIQRQTSDRRNNPPKTKQQVRLDLSAAPITRSEVRPGAAAKPGPTFAAIKHLLFAR